LLERSLKFLENKNYNRNRKLSEIEAKEKSKCTFSPRINSFSPSSKQGNLSVSERLLSYREIYRRKLQLKKNELLQSMQGNDAFKPKICKNTYKILKQKEKLLKELKRQIKNVEKSKLESHFADKASLTSDSIGKMQEMLNSKNKNESVSDYGDDYISQDKGDFESSKMLEFSDAQKRNIKARSSFSYNNYEEDIVEEEYVFIFLNYYMII